MLKPFRPNGDTTALSVTTSNTQGTVPPHSSQVLVQCATGTAFLRFAGAAATAVAATDMPIIGPFCKVIDKGAAGHVAAICASGTATVYLTPGEGQ